MTAFERSELRLWARSGSSDDQKAVILDLGEAADYRARFPKAPAADLL